MARPSDLLDVHQHLADASQALARAVRANPDAGELVPLARLITDAQAELLRVSRPAVPPGSRDSGDAVR